MQKTIDIWTIQMGGWRLAKERNIPILDITAKSGVQEFAPLFSVVMDYKNGLVSEEVYTEMYMDKMNESLILHPDVWKTLKEYKTVALACYCKPNTFCHRVIFSYIMKDYLEDNGFIVNLNGELLKG